MLTTFQRQLLHLVAELPEASRFALAGGAALILRGTVDRRTNDLDFFSAHEDTPAEAIRDVAEATEAALYSAGVSWSRDVVSETFARLTVSGPTEECRIDFATDVRIREPERTESAAVLSLEELAADKVLALFGRAAARDFQDVAALREHFSWPQLLAITVEKDAGFTVGRFLEAVAAFDRLGPEEFDLSPTEYHRLSNGDPRLAAAAWSPSRSGPAALTGMCTSTAASIPVPLTAAHDVAGSQPRRHRSLTTCDRMPVRYRRICHATLWPGGHGRPVRDAADAGRPAVEGESFKGLHGITGAA